jgi:hypothetical protein
LTVQTPTSISQNLQVDTKVKSVVKSGAKNILNVLKDGRVGVGKMPEDHDFEIAGNLKVNKDLFVSVLQLSTLGPLRVDKIGRVGFKKTPLKHELEIGGNMAVSKEMTVINPSLSNLGQIYFSKTTDGGITKERVGFGGVRIR